MTSTAYRQGLPEGRQSANDSISVVMALDGSVQAVRLDEASSTVTYVGVAAVGTAESAALWSIKKISVSGTVTSITWAGSGANTESWNNRASLSYS